MLKYRTVKNANSNKWVLFLYCIGGNANIYRHQYEEFSKNYNILYIDLPGHGDTKEYMNNFTISDITKDVITILNNLEIESTNIISISLGSLVAFDMCINHQNRVEKSVFVGAIILTRILRLLFIVFNKTKKVFPKKLYLFCFIFSILPEHKYKLTREKFIQRCSEIPSPVLFELFDNMANHFVNMKENMAQLQVSDVDKLFIVGEQDRVFKGAHKSLQNTLTMPDCGHLCNMDKAQDFNNIVLDFFECDNTIEFLKRAKALLAETNMTEYVKNNYSEFNIEKAPLLESDNSKETSGISKK